METRGGKCYGPSQWRPKPDDIRFSYAYFCQFIFRKDNGKLAGRFIVGIANPTTEAEIKEEIWEAFQRTDWPWEGYYLDKVLYGPYKSAAEAQG